MNIWAGLRSIHITLDGNLLRTLSSRLAPEDLATLTMRGAHPAGPPPAKPALQRLNGLPTIPAGEAVEVDRRVTKDGIVSLAGDTHLVGFAYAGRTVTLRLDGHLMHAIADNALIGTWPCPLSTERLPRLTGARSPSTPLPPPPLPAGSLHVQRRVHETGRFMVAKQRIKLGKRHAGKLVTVVIEDTHLRVLHNGEEIALRPRRNLAPITPALHHRQRRQTSRRLTMSRAQTVKDLPRPHSDTRAPRSRRTPRTRTKKPE
nr:hypothetical protein [Saccharopolyspora gloriosae]